MVHKFKNKVDNFLFSEMPVDSMDFERYVVFETFDVTNGDSEREFHRSILSHGYKSLGNLSQTTSYPLDNFEIRRAM